MAVWESVAVTSCALCEGCVYLPLWHATQAEAARGSDPAVRVANLRGALRLRHQVREGRGVSAVCLLLAV